MIGYNMGSSLAGFGNMVKTSLMKNFKLGWKNDMTTNMQYFLLRYFSRVQVFLGKLKS